jgi:hypothetical protein
VRVVVVEVEQFLVKVLGSFAVHENPSCGDGW